MKKKLNNQIDQLSIDEQMELSEYLQKHYAVDFIGEIMRDGIRDKIFEMIKLLFADDKFEVQEHFSFAHLDMDAIDVTQLSDSLIIEFELDGIPFSTIMEFQKVKDVVDYIENIFEER